MEITFSAYYKTALKIFIANKWYVHLQLPGNKIIYLPISDFSFLRRINYLGCFVFFTPPNKEEFDAPNSK